MATTPLPRATYSAASYRGISNIVETIEEKVMVLADKKRPVFLKLKKDYADRVIGDVTVGGLIGGMRGMKALLCETSLLDEYEGIEYRGHTLKEVMARLPTAPKGEGPVVEGCIWLLLTDDYPSDAERDALTKELHKRSEVPESAIKLLDSLPKDMHAMTQLSMGIMACQPDSAFAKAYSSGTLKRADYWKFVLEDSLDLIARLPILAARIFRNQYFDGKHIAPDYSLDWAGNYAHMLGVSDSEDFKDVTRLYLVLHADHEGGNVSAHTTHLVGSALSDPYLAFAAGVNGLAGPLHGLANQECLRWLKATHEALGGKEPTVEALKKFAEDTLAAGKVIPGFGHGVLRKTDPRYAIQREFAMKHFPDDPLLKLANKCYEAIPEVLMATGKVKNPWPNVDALSGTCMQHFGLTQQDYYTVVFAVSRVIGCSANLVWSRLMGLPIERPKSVNMDWMIKNVVKQAEAELP